MANNHSRRLLTVADVIDDQAGLHWIVQARQLARFTRRLAFGVVVFGVVSLVATVYFWVTGTTSVDEAVNSLTITALGSILAGVASYGSSVALNLSASNLARRLQQVLGSE